MNIEHISVSRANVWNTCQQQYKYRYHLKVPVEGPTAPPLVFGSLVHKIIEEYTRSGGKRDINEIRQGCLTGEILIDKKQDFIPEKVLSKAYLSKLPRHLKSFMKLSDKLGMKGQVEWEFKYDLDPPNGKHVYGFVDRLILGEDSALIVDYKTTKKGPWQRTKRDVVIDPQLQCYALVVWKTLGIDPSNIRSALYYFEGEVFLGAVFAKETLERAERELLRIYNNISSMPPEKARGDVGRHCERCDYRKICPFYSLTG